MYVASGSYDGTVRIWDAETGDVVAGPFTGHTHVINSVTISQDGKFIASGSDDKTVRIWDAEGGKKEVISPIYCINIMLTNLFLTTVIISRTCYLQTAGTCKMDGSFPTQPASFGYHPCFVMGSCAQTIHLSLVM